MQVYVQCKQFHALTVDNTATVASLESLLKELENLKGVRLSFRTRFGQVLQDKQLLSDVVKGGVHIDAEIRVLGGKRRSMTHIGTVRAQTPKVEKIDRLKKKKTGRAEKRQKYNQRFTNSTGNGGKPNVALEYL